jgi:hypothetical protein
MKSTPTKHQISDSNSCFPQMLFHSPPATAAFQQLVRKRIGLIKSKRFVEWMWSEHLVCSNIVGRLFGTLLKHGARKHYGRS